MRTAPDLTAPARARHLVALALLLVLSRPVLAAPAPERAEARAAADQNVEQLRAELELARSDAFYLRIDPARRTLELLLRGVVLERYPALALERGTARAAFRNRPAPPGPQRVRYASGRLEPPRERDRIEIQAPTAPGAAMPPPIPLTAEESISVPVRWRVVFAEGLILEVDSPGGGRNRGVLRRAADAWSSFWSDRARALDSAARGQLWLRARLAPEHAAALYRALPPDVGLVVRSAGAD